MRTVNSPGGIEKLEDERRSPTSLPTSLHQEREIHLFTFCKHLNGSRLRLEAWDDKATGEKKYKTEIICDNFHAGASSSRPVR